MRPFSTVASARALEALRFGTNPLLPIMVGAANSNDAGREAQRRRSATSSAAAGVLALCLAFVGTTSGAFAQNRDAPAATLAPVALGIAGDFAVLTKTGISSTGDTQIVGSIGVSPISHTAITGFALTLASSGKYSTSARVTGKVFAADYADPTPAMLTTAIGDMQSAYADAASRKNPRATELANGNIGGRVIKPGLYKWSSNVLIAADLTLKGDENAVWIFQIDGTLDITSGKMVVLADGAQAKNIFWQVAGRTTLATTSVMKGNILGKTAIVFKTGSQLHGRALAQTAVTLDATAITRSRP